MADVRPSPQSQGLIWDGSAWQPVVDVDQKSAAPNTRVGIQAVGIGPGFQHKLNPSNLGTAVNSAITNTVDGADYFTYHIGTGTTGTFTFEVTADDTNWLAAEFLEEPAGIGLTGSSPTPVANKVYRVKTTGWRQVRIRTVSTLGATTAIKTTSYVNYPAAKPGAHEFPYALICKVVQTTTTQTGSDVWSPASGKRICVLSYQLQAGGTVAGAVQLWFGLTADTTYTRGTDRAIFDGEFAPSATLKPGVVQSGVWHGIPDEEVHLTTSAAINPLTVNLWGYEF
jgi:hypothetical protein